MKARIGALFKDVYGGKAGTYVRDPETKKLLPVDPEQKKKFVNLQAMREQHGKQGQKRLTAMFRALPKFRLTPEIQKQLDESPTRKSTNIEKRGRDSSLKMIDKKFAEKLTPEMVTRAIEQNKSFDIVERAIRERYGK
jgi:hypothetical protein